MNKRVVVGSIIAAVVFLGTLGSACAPVGTAVAKASDQCLYTGPFASMLYHNGDPPTRIDLDADAHSVKLIRKVQTNWDPNNPFRPGTFAEQATCRLRLDCVVPRQGLKKAGLITTQFGKINQNTYIEVGSKVDFTYADASHKLTCRVVGVDLL
jgi:hypothetical protein